jgi:hypothetical protein
MPQTIDKSTEQGYPLIQEGVGSLVKYLQNISKIHAPRHYPVDRWIAHLLISD